jgi:glutaminyl-peptide cyclotransferase
LSKIGSQQRTLALAVAVSLAVVSTTCGGADGEPGARSAPSSTPTYPRFDGESAYELVKKQVEFGPRVPGTPGHRAMAEWVEARFRPSAASSILLLAHWDTRPISDQAEDPKEQELPVPGANDGASGTAILLELADMLSQSAPPRGVDILLVDGEDYGDFAVGEDVFLGSRYFASNMPDGYAAEFGVLLDMVGDRKLHIYVEGNSNRLAPEVVDRVWNIAQRMGFGDVFHRETNYTINDDHIPLNDAGIPTIDIISWPYDYWHTPDDTPDKVSGSSLAVVGAVMTRLIYRGN